MNQPAEDILIETVTTRTTRRVPADKVTDDITHVALLIDESESMLGAKAATLDGINEYISTLRSKPGRYRITLTMFNSLHGCRVVFADWPLADVKLITADHYRPAGMTPLYDAVGTTVRRMAETIRGSARVLVVIQTDGMENVSKAFNQFAIRDLVQSKEREGWTFLYLGADLTPAQSMQAAQTMGLHTSNAMSYGKDDTKSVFHSMGASTQTFAQNQAVGSASADFYQQHGDEMLKKVKDQQQG